MKKIKEDLITKKIGITPTGIERLHRLGRKSNGKSRPVIIKFLDYR